MVIMEGVCSHTTEAFLMRGKCRLYWQNPPMDGKWVPSDASPQFCQVYCGGRLSSLID